MAEKTAQRALVVGLGVTGLSCARHLVARGYAVTVVDTRKEPPLLNALQRDFPQVEVHTGGFDARLFDRPGLLVVSPGVSLREPVIAQAVTAGADAVGDIELFAREAASPVIAVTGANGKSTVTALAGEMCRAAGWNTAVGGNIGVPALSLLDRPEPDIYVLELSSFQLETTHSLDAKAATVLNVSPDHLDRYRDMEEYAAVKARIFNGNGAMVLNRDDPRVIHMARPNRPTIKFGLTPPAAASDYGVVEHNGDQWLAKGERLIMSASEIPLPGKHNFLNVMAAMALAEIAGVSEEVRRRAVCAFKGLPHRMEPVAGRDGVRWINDSKGTNVGATVAALNGLSAPVVLIAGGEAKGADFHELKGACEKRARAVVLIGKDAPLIEGALAGVIPVHRAADMIAAVKTAKKLARPGDVVLLSPACASFDMFRDYAHRGEVFKAAVKEVLG